MNNNELLKIYCYIMSMFISDEYFDIFYEVDNIYYKVTEITNESNNVVIKTTSDSNIKININVDKLNLNNNISDMINNINSILKLVIYYNSYNVINNQLQKFDILFQSLKDVIKY